MLLNYSFIGAWQVRSIIWIVLPMFFGCSVSPATAVWRNTMQLGEASIRDSFTNARPELHWLPYPNFNQDNLHGTIDETSPEGEPGVGVLDNKIVGGFAALSYAATNSLSDFYLETWMYAQVTPGDKGPLNGIAFHIDTVSGNFYRVATQFMGPEPGLSLAYVGKETNHYPKYLARWKGAEIPGGAPQNSGWQKIAISVQDGKAEIYWNETKLPGGPFPVDRVQSGYIGVYANFVGGLGHAETKVDGLRVWPRK